MIINDFSLKNFLNNKINIFILLEDSLRSLVVLKIIKAFFKKKCVFEEFENFDYQKYKKVILVFRKINYDFLNSTYIFELLSKKNIIIFVLNNFKNNFFLKKINETFKNSILIINFRNLENSENILWLKQFLVFKSFYCNEKILNYLSYFLKKDFECFISSLKTYLKSTMYKNNFLLSILLNTKITIENFYLEKSNEITHNMIFYSYKKNNNYNNLLNNYYLLKKNNKIVLYFLIVLDINLKNNTISHLELIFLNFIINNYFKNKKRENNFDKFNIKYITKK